MPRPWRIVFITALVLWIAGLLGMQRDPLAPPSHRANDEGNAPSPPSCKAASITYQYVTQWRFSDAAADAHARHVLHGPRRIHIACARIHVTGHVTLLAAWDNPSYPQERELPFTSMLDRWSVTTASTRNQVRNVTVCFFLQDDVEELMSEATLPNAREIRGGVPSFSNLIRRRGTFSTRRPPTQIAIPFPDHTFAHWKAGKQRPFVEFYNDAVCNDASPMRRLTFSRRRDVVFWRGQSTAAGRSRGNGGIGRRAMVHHIRHTLGRVNPQLFDVSVVSVYFLNRTSDDAQYVSLEDHARYRYLLDLPGYGYSGRLKYLMLLGSVVLSVEHPDVEYWHQFLCPWVHYVPIRRDLSDLMFAIELLRSRFDVAERIAEAGRTRAALLFSEAARFQYMSDVLSAYAHGRGVAVTGIEGVSQCLSADKARSIAMGKRCAARLEKRSDRRCHIDPDAATYAVQMGASFHRAVCFSIRDVAHAVPSPDGGTAEGGPQFAVEHVGSEVPFHRARRLEDLWERCVCHGVASVPAQSWCVVDTPPPNNAFEEPMNHSDGRCLNERSGKVLFAWRTHGDTTAPKATTPDPSFAHWSAFFELYSRSESFMPWTTRNDVLYWRGPSPKVLQNEGGGTDARSVVAAMRAVQLGHADAGTSDNVGQNVSPIRVDALFTLDATTKAGGGFEGPTVDWGAVAQHRYVLDMPGYGRFGHLKHLLLLGCTVLVVETSLEAYWMALLQPWVHYAPVRWDLRDIDEVLERLRKNTTLAASLAVRGRQLVLHELAPAAVAEHMLTSLMGDK